MDRLPAHNFSYRRWLNGSLADLGLRTRTAIILLNKKMLKEHAIGWIEGERLWVRPKPNYIAVMFFINDYHFWTHLTKEEFNIINN